MPTCAELAKKIEALESAFKEQLETAVKEFKAEARKTLDDKGLEEHAKLCESVKFLSAQYDNMCVKQNALIAENKALRAHNESLETRLAEREQYSRQNNIEIKGVPTTKGEDCTAILKRMGDAIGCTVTPADIDTVHRVPTKSAVNNIIARFCSRDKKMTSSAKLARLGFAPATLAFRNLLTRLFIRMTTLLLRIRSYLLGHWLSRKSTSGNFSGQRTVAS